jgi:predicted transcriptional regulator
MTLKIFSQLQGGIFLMAYRSRMHIQAEILEAAACHETASKTRIMYRVALSYFQLCSYLKDLTEMGLLEYDGGISRYNTTTRGQEFLKSFKQLNSLME